MARGTLLPRFSVMHPGGADWGSRRREKRRAEEEMGKGKQAGRGWDEPKDKGTAIKRETPWGDGGRKD